MYFLISKYSRVNLFKIVRSDKKFCDLYIFKFHKIQKLNFIR